MDVLNQLFSTFKVESEIFYNVQYCGNWAIDTSGTQNITFHLVTHGKCELLTSANVSEVIGLTVGDIVIFPRDMKHQLCNNASIEHCVNVLDSPIPFSEGLKESSTGLLCGCFSHRHPQITQLTSQLPDYIIIRRESAEDDSLCKLIQVLINESQSHQNDSIYILNKLSETILALIFRDHLNVEKGLLAALAHPKLYVAISAMHSAPETKWTVEMLANKVNMSRGSFSSLFKELVEISPIEYLTQWRLSKAYRILADEKESVLAVALQCGYDNESSFSKAFKRVMGVSPGEIRAR